MKSRSCRAAFLFALAVVTGCASTDVTQQTPMVNEAITRPNRIWVYDFVASSSGIPADSSIGGKVSAPPKPQTAEQIATGGELRRPNAKDLDADIQAMGFSAARAEAGSCPQGRDGGIRGHP